MDFHLDVLVNNVKITE